MLLSPATGFIVAATAVLCWLGVSDAKQRRLSNLSVLLFATLYIGFWWLGGHQASVFTAHGSVAAAGLTLFGVFYVLGWMAGGDVKLAAVVLLWAGPEHATGALMVTALSGIAIASAQLLAKPYLTPDSVWHASRGTPYGVALAAGGMWAIWRPFFGGPALF